MSSAIAQENPTPEWRILIGEAMSLKNQNILDSARIKADSSLILALREFPSTHLNIGRIKFQIGLIDMNSGNLMNAKVWIEEALDIANGEPFDSSKISQFSNTLGYVYEQLGNYLKAESLYVSSLKIRLAIYGEENKNTANSLANLASLYITLNKINEARPLLERAMKIRESLFGPESQDVATTLYDLGDLEQSSGHVTIALNHFHRSLEIIQSQENVDIRQVGTALNFLGAAYFDFGLYREADSIYQLALQTMSEIFEPNHPDLGRINHNIGLVKTDMGDYFNAEPFLSKALDIFQSEYGENSPDVGDFVLSLGNLYDNLGNHKKTKEMYERSLQIKIKVFGEDHDNTALGYNNLGHFHLYYGSLDSAKILFEKALEISSKSKDESPQEQIIPLHNLALVAFKQNKLESAESYCNQAIMLIQNAYGQSHPDLARNYLLLAQTTGQSENQDSTRYLFNKAIEIFSEVYGSDHWDVSEANQLYAEWMYSVGEVESAQVLALESIWPRLNSFKSNVRFLSEYDALNYGKKTRQAALRMIGMSLNDNSNTESIREETAKLILNIKGFVTDALAQRAKLIQNSEDEKTDVLVTEFRATRSSLSNLYFSRSIESSQASIDSLSHLADSLESLIARTNSQFGAELQSKTISVEQFAKRIPENGTFVQFGIHTSPSINTQSEEEKYYALTVQSDGKFDFFDLGPTTKIDKQVQDYRSHIKKVSESGAYPTKENKKEFSNIAKKLYGLIIEPLASQIENTELLIVSPERGLQSISFASLIDSNDKYLIEKTAVHYVSTAKDLTKNYSNERKNIGLLAVGDVNFDIANKTTEVDMQKDQESFKFRAGIISRGKINARPLVHTADELKTVTKLWKDNFDSTVVQLTGSAATEEIFKQSATGKRVIHLATHGFFLENKTNDSTLASPNPLLRSGILFAGVNSISNNTSSSVLDDGILTAYEIAGLNLAGTEKVILSACETGLGDTQDGEGVFGLRRAFQLAGANTVISALWPVSDEETSEFMKIFYQDSEIPIYKRIQAVQIKKIEQLRNSVFSDHPFTWSAFIAQGSWK